MLYASRFLRLTNPLMTGPDVRNVQERLASLGYYSGKVDGIYGKVTAAAVQNFQNAVGLTADGVVGPDTWNALGLPKDPININHEYSISIDVQKFRLTLLKNGVIQATYPVAVGKPNTPTPIGNWVIIEKLVNPGGPFGARWMRLNVPWGGYGIHGTNNPASIGSPASHGCVRMYNEDVIKLFAIVPIGTPVKIIGRVFTGRILQVGVEPGSDVVAVQEKLQVLGYYQGDVDGVYGSQTRNAVMAFQKAHKLATDGIVGPATYEELEKTYDTVLGLTMP
ncbi:peptidoglycan-binding protein [Bacillota bacterium LX-D]|nr:peptidoglycan-binding protein [Bacillota bacterium LX-D]